MVEPDWKGIGTLFMEIKEPGMNVWLQKKCTIPRSFVVIVIVGLWSKDNGKFAFFKWIFPFLSGDYITNDAF